MFLQSGSQATVCLATVSVTSTAPEDSTVHVTTSQQLTKVLMPLCWGFNVWRPLPACL